MQYFCVTVTANYHATFFHDELIHWHTHFNEREMPWKGELDPYRIWLSEIILQQTRVEQGMAYYKRFIERYPDVGSLAEAKDEEVFKLWEGLGYYSRCKNLIASARKIASDYEGRFPSTYDEILELKGVGEYTAAAIASFAYNLPYAVVDGNVQRVLARFFGLNTPVDSTEGRKIFSSLAQELVTKKKPGFYNQAIMDFGAIICKPRLPLCITCPLQTACTAYLTGTVNELPVKQKKQPKKERWFYYFKIGFAGGFYVRKRTGKDIWQNLYEFILSEQLKQTSVDDLLADPVINPLLHRNYKLLSVSIEHKQVLTHLIIQGKLIYLELSEETYIPGYEWVSEPQLKKLAFPRFINAFEGI